jgi:hypothetical protein
LWRRPRSRRPLRPTRSPPANGRLFLTFLFFPSRNKEISGLRIFFSFLFF